ncbi:hypothetical protein GF327_05060, partial [Candidatus Woesearchaeota archaeon]|nr:hypothetical protein [Candidatus Woesearchaeota archaeon]
MDSKKIMIGHFRVGKTDGVSLEISKRKKMLEKMGHKVYLLSGPRQVGADFVIDELEVDEPRIAKLRENTITKFEDYEDEEEMKKELYAIHDSIKKQLRKIFEENNFDVIYIHNMLSLAIHIPATMALVQLIKELEIPCVAINHDFYWEGDIRTNPTFPFVKELIEKYFVPKLPNVMHGTINTLNHKKLLEERKIKAVVNYDVFDFSQDPWVKDGYNS